MFTVIHATFSSQPILALPVVHHCTLTIACCSQTLSTRYSRNLLTLQKCRAYDEAASLASIAAQEHEFKDLDSIHEVVYESKAREAAGQCKPAVKQYYRCKLV